MAVYQPSVLIIDDQPGIRRLLSEILEDEGYNVIVAANGYEGVQRASDTNPDVILMDMKMPGMNGMEALKEIKRQGQTDRVIMMTAYGEIDTINEVMSAGVRDCITKPFDIKRLCQAIEETIASRYEKSSKELMLG